jgi:hypothetical protein
MTFVLEWRTRRGSRRGVLNLIYLAGEERKLLDDGVANRIRPAVLPCGPAEPALAVRLSERMIQKLCIGGTSGISV